MVTRNLNRPSYVLALLLGFVALVDAANGFITMQIPDVCRSVSGLCLGSTGNANAGWLVDLGAAVVSAALLALLLLRPHLYIFAATFGWSTLAFLTNLAMRHSVYGPDAIATVRMTVYLLVAVMAAVLVVVEVQVNKEAEKEAAAAVQPAPPPPPPAPPAN
jgi:hypothetical protein